ncbi:hypothetical protein [Croceicoccus bisphenolivorans]|uniref:hypothetical protein n=1 Tax=Croceicoccus bisphenolivorans TaxID=1783232 RepID=UPI000833870A|nr:hypothetical protein [Croceicoccus bisphenolivorans]
MRRNDFLAVLALFGFAFLVRHATFGNPTLEPDESFYLLVGIKMHDGLLPYVDIYDRKPFGLFVIYYLITFVTEQPAGYQIVATLFAGATAVVIYLFRPDRYGVLGGFLYLAGLNLVFGNGGQSPVFYNLLIAVAALMVRRDRHVLMAMVLCGIAITIKHSAVFESIWLGLYAMRTRPWRYMPKMVALGCLPFALTVLPFLGHLQTFWDCVISAPLDNDVQSPVLGLKRLIEAFPVVVTGFGGLLLAKNRAFLGGWIGFTILSFLAIPNYYPHYLLPAILPLSIAATHLRWGVLPFLALAIWMKWPFDYERTHQARIEFERLDRAVAAQQGVLAVRHGPVLLYRDRAMPHNVWQPMGEIVIDLCDEADFLYLPREQTFGVCITRGGMRIDPE